MEPSPVSTIHTSNTEVSIEQKQQEGVRLATVTELQAVLSAVTAYFLSGLLRVIIALYSDPHHSGLVHNFLDDLTVLTNHFTYRQRARRIKRRQGTTQLTQLPFLLTNKVPGHLDRVLYKLQVVPGFFHCLF